MEVEYKEDLFSNKVHKFLYEGAKDSGFQAEPRMTPSEGALKPGASTKTKNFNISYLSCDRFEGENKYNQPEDGYEFIYFEFEFEKIGSGERSVSWMDFHCYADGKICGSKTMSRDDELSGTLSEGRKAKGTVAFEVPIGAQVIEVEYEESLLSDGFVIFSFQK